MPLLLFLGDSHTDGTGASPGQSWPEQLQRSLDRTDVALVNFAQSGLPLGAAVAAWDQTAAPALSAAEGLAAEGLAIVFVMGGYNDAALGAGAGDILDAYRRAAALARAAGARCLCGLDVIRLDGGTGVVNPLIRRVNATLRDQASGFCDGLVDFAGNEPRFDRPDGPYEQPPFAADQVHLCDEGQRMMAAIARPVFAALLDGVRG